MRPMSFERVLRWALVAIAVTGIGGGYCRPCRRPVGARRSLFGWLATAPVVAGLAVSIVRDFLAGRLGVDAIALVSMSAALALGQPLAGAVVALMYSGGNVLEDIAIARAEHDLRSLVDRAPREAHRRVGDRIEEVPIAAVAVGDQLLVRAGEVIPVDGVVTSAAATIDESALTGEPIPVVKARGAAHSLRLVECRRNLRADGVRGGRRKHLCRHRAAGDRGADREGAVRAAGRPLCADLPAGDARRSPSSPG